MAKASSSSSLSAQPVAQVATPANFEVAMSELETLVSQLESGELPLEQLLTGYQRGAALLGYCRERLDAVEGQIRVLDEGTLKSWTPE